MRPQTIIKTSVDSCAVTKPRKKNINPESVISETQGLAQDMGLEHSIPLWDSLLKLLWAYPPVYLGLNFQIK